MQKIRVKFIDDFDGYPQPENTSEYKMLARHFEVQIVKKGAIDLVVTRMVGQNFRKYDCPVMAISAEIFYGHPAQFDLFLSPEAFCFPKYKECCHYYMSVFEYDGFRQLLASEPIPDKITAYKSKPKTKFCAFMYSNEDAYFRIAFAKKFLKRQQIDCLGKILHNVKTFIPKGEQGTLEVYSDYKFVIAFENRARRGYVSEKLIQSLLVGAIPIYWGAPDVDDYVNPDSFINIRDFKSFDACIDYVEKVAKDETLYKAYQNSPMLLPTSKFYQHEPSRTADAIKDKIRAFVSPDYTPVKLHPWAHLFYNVRRRFYIRWYYKIQYFLAFWYRFNRG